MFRLIGEFVRIERPFIFDWYSYVALGLIIYYLSIEGYSTRRTPQLQFDPRDLPLRVGEAEKESLPDLENWKQRLVLLMKESQPYLEPELNLTQLSRLLDTHPAMLSRIINVGFHQNFNDFVNEYRVRAVMEKLKAGEQQKKTLLGIALDSGFNSKATFNRAFKKLLVVSPKEWLSQIS